MIVKQQNFDQLIDNVYQTHCLLKSNAEKAVDNSLTVINWLIGCYIVEYEQNGSDRAKYSAHLLDEIAKALKSKELKGLDTRSLRDCRTFYTTYPQIRGSLSPEFDNEYELPVGLLSPKGDGVIISIRS